MNRVVSEKVPVDQAVDELIARSSRWRGDMCLAKRPGDKSSLSRSSQGEGRGEGLSQRARLAESPLNPTRCARRPLPARGRGERSSQWGEQRNGDHAFSIRVAQRARFRRGCRRRRSGHRDAGALSAGVLAFVVYPVCYGCGWRGIRRAMSRSITIRSSRAPRSTR